MPSGMCFSTQNGMSLHSKVLKIILNRHGLLRLLRDLKLVDLDRISLFVLTRSVSHKFLLVLKFKSSLSNDNFIYTKE